MTQPSSSNRAPRTVVDLIARMPNAGPLHLRRGFRGAVNIQAMARAYLVFGDIEGKLDILRVECTRCPRKGSYSVQKLIEKYGRKANMMKWREMLPGDCPKRDAPQLHDRCDLICPDLPKVI